MVAPKKSRGLGKGLDALFGDAEVAIRVSEDDVTEELQEEAGESKRRKKKKATKNAYAVAGEGISYIDINDIKPNSNQPRRVFDDEKLEELAASIEEHGLIQPIVLRTAKRGYEIVAGERRWRAARKLGIKEVPCIVRELSDEENMLLAIIENMQREDLNPIEEAEGLHQMIETYGLTQAQVSKSIGKSRPYITNCLRLLKLTDDVKDYVTDGSLSMGHAKALAAISAPEKQIALAKRSVKEGLSVRQIENMAKESRSAKRRPAKRKKDADTKRVEEDLKEALGAKVTLNHRGKKGKIEIEYYDRDDLERLIELLKTLK